MVRWSFWRLVLGAHRLNQTGQVGDGRERAVVDYVCRHARRGDIDDVLGTFDWYAYHKSLLINVGDVKGELLDAAVKRADPLLARTVEGELAPLALDQGMALVPWSPL